MRTKTVLLLVMSLAFVGLVVGGCTLAKIGGRGVKPIILNNPSTKVEVVDHVKISKRVMFDYTNSYDASEILSDLFVKNDADAIINVTFTLKTTVGDFFINLFTLGIANAKTMTIEGDLVKMPSGFGALSPAGTEMLAESENLIDLVPIMETEFGENESSGMLVRVPTEDDGVSYRLVR